MLAGSLPIGKNKDTWASGQEFPLPRRSDEILRSAQDDELPAARQFRPRDLSVSLSAASGARKDHRRLLGGKVKFTRASAAKSGEELVSGGNVLGDLRF